MATYNEDTQYELMDFANIFDLRNARLVRAQIDTIYPDTNTAAVTLLDECTEVSALDLTQVPFFYHCDFSTGTLEDLAFGYSAFEPSQYVYMIYAPENADILERLYIIGHVDIRGTRTCCTDLIMATLPYGKLTEEKHAITIFSPWTGTVLDMATFVNKDELSPPKPASLPCERTEAILNWVAYNFSSPVPVASVNCSSEIVYPTTTTTYSYTCNGTTYNGDPPLFTTLCDDLSLGNASHSVTHTSEARNTFGTITTLESSFSCSDPLKVAVTGGCGFYWQALHRSSTTVVSNTAQFTIEITDNITSGVTEIPYSVYFEGSQETTSACDGDSLEVSASIHQRSESGFDFSDLSGYSFTRERSRTLGATFVAGSNVPPSDPYVYCTEIPLDAMVGTDRLETQSSSALENVIWDCVSTPGTDCANFVKIGGCGCYVFLGTFSYTFTRNDLTCHTGSMTGIISCGTAAHAKDMYYSVPSACTTASPWTGVLPPGYNGSTSVSLYDDPGAEDFIEFSLIASASVNRFDESFDLTEDVSITACLAAADYEASRLCAESIMALADWVSAEVGNDYDDRFYCADRMSVGPTFTVLRKQPVTPP